MNLGAAFSSSLSLFPLSLLFSLSPLTSGYSVVGTVRSLTNSDAVGYLQALGEKYDGRLRLVEADLLNEGSFDEAVKGCTGVFHTAR